MTTPLLMNSHILVQEFDLHRPTSVAEAVALLEQYNGRATVLAGGTDLLVNMKMERAQAEQVIAISRVKSLKAVAASDDGLTIGALATFYDVQQANVIRQRYQALNEAAHSVSGTQIKMMGTIGGNLCNASPAADSAPALLLYDAQVELTGAAGSRRVALADFFTGPGQTVRQANELLTGIILVPPQPAEGSAFLKLGRVGADIAKVSAAVRLVRDGQRVAEGRIALGSVAPTPVRARQAEARLAGQPFDLALAEAAAQLAAQEIAPISDVRSTAAYRARVAYVLVRDALLAAWDRSIVINGQSMSFS